MRTTFLLGSLAAILIDVQIESAELVLPGWDRSVDTDTPAQKIILFRKVYLSGNTKLSTRIMQVRNDDSWHWQQSFSVEVEGREQEECHLVVAGEANAVLRYYVPPHATYTMVIGIAEDGDEGMRPGQGYVAIQSFGDSPLRFPFKRGEDGVYVYAGKIDKLDF